MIEIRTETAEIGKPARWAGLAVLLHSSRTAVSALVSVLVARLFRLPEAYWAPITTLVITQSSLGAALTVSWQRFVGTALGAVVGAIAASYVVPGGLVFAASIFILGCCAPLCMRIEAHIGSGALRWRSCC